MRGLGTLAVNPLGGWMAFPLVALGNPRSRTLPPTKHPGFPDHPSLKSCPVHTSLPPRWEGAEGEG